MKATILQIFLVIICGILIVSCRKNNTPETPVNPKGDVMSFSFAEAMLQPSGIVILATPAKLEGLFIDLGDGKFIPLAKNGIYDSPNAFAINKPAKGKNLRIKGKVKGIGFSSGNIVSMDLSQNILPEKIAVRNTTSTFAQLNLTKNTALKEIYCASAGLLHFSTRITFTKCFT